MNFQFKEDGSDKGRCKPILLFHNIQTIINQNKTKEDNEKYQIGVFYKFPFHLYKIENWDVEHINSNTTNPEEGEDTQKEWLFNIYLGVNDEIQALIKNYFEEDDVDVKNTLFEQIQQIYPSQVEWSDQEKNRIWNYTLLDSSTNRSYGNSIFSGKRRVIIGKDKGKLIPIPKWSKNKAFVLDTEEKEATSSFIPQCTKQVFMKYYSSIFSDPNYWTKEDALGYKNDILGCIKTLED